MDVVGSTYVGGSSPSAGWQMVDPFANLAALGMPPSARAQASSNSNVVADIGVGLGYVPTGATVGGNWSPEPAGNNQILYAHYSNLMALPQATAGPQLVANTPVANAAPAPAPVVAATPAEDARKSDDEKQSEDAGKSVETSATKKTYTVKSGDSLSKIAKELGLGNWRAIYELNKDVVGSDPNKIKPGQVLKLP